MAERGISINAIQIEISEQSVDINNAREDESSANRTLSETSNIQRRTIMHCTNCGSQIDKMAVACLICGYSPRSQRKYCNNCGNGTDPQQIICTKCGVSLESTTPATKNRITAGILSLTLGGLGIHKFYLGSWFWGLIYFLLCWIYVPMIISIFEGIKYLKMSDSDFQSKYNESTKSAFRW